MLSAEAIEFFREQSKDKLPRAPLFTEHGEHLGVVMSGQKQCAPRSQKESDKFALMAVINLGQLHGTCACRAPTWFIAPLLARRKMAGEPVQCLGDGISIANALKEPLGEVQYPTWSARSATAALSRGSRHRP